MGNARAAGAGAGAAGVGDKWEGTRGKCTIMTSFSPPSPHYSPPSPLGCLEGLQALTYLCPLTSIPNSQSPDSSP